MYPYNPIQSTENLKRCITCIENSLLETEANTKWIFPNNKLNNYFKLAGWFISLPIKKSQNYQRSAINPAPIRY